jgi:hypothetical protein
MARHLNVSKGTVRFVLIGRTWRHVHEADAGRVSAPETQTDRTDGAEAGGEGESA